MSSLRRVARSAVDWVAFAERVPPNQVEAFRAFKAKCEAFVTRVHRHPEQLPAIDFTYYRSRIATPAIVDQFEKSYRAVTIPYPADKDNVLADIDEEQKTAVVQSQKQIEEAKKMIEEAKALLAKIDSVPSLDVMTHEMYAEYFPDQARSVKKSQENPTFWPHTKNLQPGWDPEHQKI